MCFSSDGWALAVGHEGALTVWNTEDGARLVCTTSDNNNKDTSSPYLTTAARDLDQTTTGAAANASGGGSGCSGREGFLEEVGDTDTKTSPSGTLDLVAGGARALTWESEGYRLVSVGGEGGVAAGGEGGGRKEAQGIVAFDFLRRARSNLSSALLSLQVCMHVFGCANACRECAVVRGAASWKAVLVELMKNSVVPCHVGVDVTLHFRFLSFSLAGSASQRDAA